MNKIYIIYHMIISINNKITGNYMNNPSMSELINFYFQKHRDYHADAFMCGRITMEESFIDKKLNLSSYQNKQISRNDYIARKHSFYAVSIDTHGKLAWQDCFIHDEDPGYNDAHIIEVLCENVDDAYLAYLQDKKISYIFCGKEKLDLQLMLQKLNNYFDIKTLLLEGGGVLGGAFIKENLIDELSFVVAPFIEDNDGIDAFNNQKHNTIEYKLKQTQLLDNGLWMRYTK